MIQACTTFIKQWRVIIFLSVYLQCLQIIRSFATTYRVVYFVSSFHCKLGEIPNSQVLPRKCLKYNLGLNRFLMGSILTSISSADLCCTLYSVLSTLYCAYFLVHPCSNCTWRFENQTSQSSFPVIHKVHNVVTSVLLKFENKLDTVVSNIKFNSKNNGQCKRALKCAPPDKYHQFISIRYNKIANFVYCGETQMPGNCHGSCITSD